MLLREIPVLMFASPVMAVSSIVSVVCAGILVVNIASDLTSSDDIYDGVYNNGSTSQYINPNQVNADHSGNIDSGYDNSPYDNSYQAGTVTRNNYSKTSRKSIQKGGGRQYFTDNAEGLPTDANSVPTEGHNAPLNANFYSGFNSPNNTSVSSNSTPVTVSATNSDIVISTEFDDIIDDDIKSPPAITSDFPSSLEHEVKISETDTHSISCRPVEANGPPCMCTYTVVDADGTNSWIDNNCG